MKKSVLHLYIKRHIVDINNIITDDLIKQFTFFTYHMLLIYKIEVYLHSFSNKQNPKQWVFNKKH